MLAAAFTQTSWRRLLRHGFDDLDPEPTATDRPLTPTPAERSPL
jgi:hypothetical protein